MLGSIGGALIFILDVWAIAMIFSSNETTGQKVFWILLVVVLPLIGFLIWFFAGPRPPSKA